MSKFVDLMKRYFGPTQKGPLKFTEWEHLKDFEKLRLKGYYATENEKKRGLVTIGWGHLVTNGAYGHGDRISMAMAEALLHADVKWAEETINQLVKVPLKQHEYNALVSFCFNIGRTQFADSTLLKLLNKGDYDGAAHQFLRWVYQSGKKLRGLERRRQSEFDMFCGDA